MAIYLARAKYSNAAFKGMVDIPQDREAGGRKLIEALGMTLHQVYFSVSTAESVFIVEVRQRILLLWRWLHHQLVQLNPSKRLRL